MTTFLNSAGNIAENSAMEVGIQFARFLTGDVSIIKKCVDSKVVFKTVDLVADVHEMGEHVINAKNFTHNMLSCNANINYTGVVKLSQNLRSFQYIAAEKHESGYDKFTPFLIKVHYTDKNNVKNFSMYRGWENIGEAINLICDAYTHTYNGYKVKLEYSDNGLHMVFVNTEGLTYTKLLSRDYTVIWQMLGLQKLVDMHQDFRNGDSNAMSVRNVALAIVESLYFKPRDKEYYDLRVSAYTKEIKKLLVEKCELKTYTEDDPMVTYSLFCLGVDIAYINSTIDHDIARDHMRRMGSKRFSHDVLRDIIAKKLSDKAPDGAVPSAKVVEVYWAKLLAKVGTSIHYMSQAAAYATIENTLAEILQ